MAVMDTTNRVTTWAGLMRTLSGQRDPLGALTKADIRAAVDAIDSFLETNAGAINSAIPQPARAQLSTAQKALLLQYVIAQRYLAGS